MFVKGIVSAIYTEQKRISVILPEYDNMTTPPLQIYGDSDLGNFRINEFVIVAVFNGDFNDAIIFSKNSEQVISELLNKMDYFYDISKRLMIDISDISEKIDSINGEEVVELTDDFSTLLKVEKQVDELNGEVV